MKLFLTISLLLLSTFSDAELVKKSKSGICHDTASSYYARTKNFTPYGSLSECLNSGGRLPKGSGAAGPTAAISSQGSSEYDRAYFGSWADEDRDCINTRHEILMKQSTSTIDTGTNRCTVSRGRWLDPYTGKTFY